MPVELKLEALDGTLTVLGGELNLPAEKQTEASVLVEIAPGKLPSGNTPVYVGVYAAGKTNGSDQNRLHRTAPMTKRNPWPLSIMVFFALAIAGAVVFVAFCNLHPTDLVAADYYEQELRYQEEMERVRRTRQLSETPGVSFIAEQHLIRIAVPAAHAGADLTGAIHLYRPSTPPWIST